MNEPRVNYEQIENFSTLYIRVLTILFFYFPFTCFLYSIYKGID